MNQLYASLIVVLFVACAGGQRPEVVTSRPATPSERGQIEAANARIVAAILAGDARAVAAAFAEDASMLPDGMPIVRGRDAIEKLYTAVFAAGVSKAEITTTELVIAGDLAVEQGTNAFTLKANGATLVGKYVVVWQRKGNEWKITIDCWNSDAN